ncbi:hypothetical protein BGX34_005505 [Mortierella sp. NVP85]|nr:hypothetical protein BGX34_005505 [Mortierella sp. NVP85]
MSRLRSSAAPFGQASYAPLRDSRHSLDSTPEDEIIDSDVISSHSHQDRRQHHSMHRLDNQELGQHILAGDSDDDSDDDGILPQQKKLVMDNAASSTSQRESSGDGSTIVSVGSNPDSPPPKYNRESFELAEPNPNRSQGHESDPEECLNSPRYDGGSQKGLGSQASSTLVIAVSGLICAGWLLDAVQHWEVFLEISELIILIPILLNLKGNLEMNLASRLSTASNMGLLDMPDTRNAFIRGNLALLQLQSLTVGSVAGLFSFVLGKVFHPTSNRMEEIALMISSSMLCAAISSFVLGSFMCALVLICRKYGINPDNIACPLASSFGDLVTLMILSGCALFLARYIETPLCVILLVALLSLIPVWVYYVRKNKFVSEVAKEGWGPVFSAMVIASTAGLTLEQYINRYPGMAMISPVLNGLTGNIGSIYASRISTSLHANVKENFRATERTLFLVHIPIEILFITIIGVLNLGDVQWSVSVVVGYAVVALTLVVIALALAKWITMTFWRWGFDPDNYALPIL